MNVETTVDLVLREDAGGVATLTLNRPKARNALSRPLMAALHAALDEIEADKSVHVVVLRGAGPGFCAGHDLKEVRGNPTRTFYETLFAECSALMMRVQSLRQPVIAEVHGIATAAGCQLVATCDLAVADADARFATPGVNIGLFCSTPMVAISRAVGRKAAMRMLLTGDLIDGREAARIGLVSEAVPAAQLDARVAELAARMASVPANQLQMHKLLVNQAYDAMGLPNTQMLATFFDGVARHSPEGVAFKARCEEVGFKQAVHERDDPFGDFGPSTFKG